MSSIGGSGAGPISNLFFDAQSGPSKWAQAREAGMAAKRSQQNAFAGQIQSLVDAASAQINTGDPDKRYTNALKMRNSVEQGVRAIANTEIARTSEANLDEMKEQIKENAKEAQERAQAARENDEAQTNAENGSAVGSEAAVAQPASPNQPIDVKLPESNGQRDFTSSDMPEATAGTGQHSATAQAAPETPGVNVESSSPSSSGGGRSGGQVHIDVVV